MGKFTEFWSEVRYEVLRLLNVWALTMCCTSLNTMTQQSVGHMHAKSLSALD